MYDHFRGEVTNVQPARAVVAAGGIGYEIKVPLRVSSRLQVGDETKLFTILHVVDGQPSLLGFADPNERALARDLMTVSGVGPSMCLAILSTWSAENVAQAILDGDAALLQQAKGVGKKTAERLCLELQERVAKLDLAAARPDGEPVVTIGPASSEDAVVALITLGYAEKDARARVEKTCANQPDLGTEDLIAAVLRG